MSKYHAKRTTIDGLWFDSYAEAQRYNELKMLQGSGAISALTVHPVYTLQNGYTTRDKRKIKPITYEGDFVYIEDGRTVVEDVKGVETPVFKLKRKMFEYLYPTYELRIV